MYSNKIFDQHLLIVTIFNYVLIMTNGDLIEDHRSPTLVSALPNSRSHTKHFPHSPESLPRCPEVGVLRCWTSHWHSERKDCGLGLCIFLLYFFFFFPWTFLYSKILTFIGNLWDSIIKWCKSRPTQIGYQDICQWHIRFIFFLQFQKNHYIMIQFRKHLNNFLVSNTMSQTSGIPKVG